VHVSKGWAAETACPNRRNVPQPSWSCRVMGDLRDREERFTAAGWNRDIQPGLQLASRYTRGKPRRLLSCWGATHFIRFGGEHRREYTGRAILRPSPSGSKTWDCRHPQAHV